MSQDPKPTRPVQPPTQPTLAEQVGQRASRKLRARRGGPPGVWFGLGMMGLIG